MNLQHERLGQLCAELRLGGVAADYAAAAQRAVETEATYPDFLEVVLRPEIETRRARTRHMLARVAGFPAVKTLDQYDFEFAAGAPRQQIMQLASLAFVERYAWFSFPTPTEGGLGTGLYDQDGTATAMGQAYRRAGPAN